MDILEQYKLYDRIIQYIHGSSNHRAPDIAVRYNGTLYQHLTRNMSTNELRHFSKDYQNTLNYLKKKGLIEYSNMHYTLTAEGEEKRIHGFAKTYLEEEKDKALNRKNIEVSITLTEQQILDIAKAKRRSRTAIIISIIALLVTSSFEGYKIYVENKKTKTENPNKDKDKPTKNNVVIPEIKNVPDTIEKSSHDSTGTKKPIKS